VKNVAKQHQDIVKKEFELIGGWVQYHTRIVERLERQTNSK
jgi:hypothetical protein